MSVFRCDQCDTLVDGDWVGCNEHPRKELELVCDECLAEIEEGIEEANDPEGTIQQLRDRLANVKYKLAQTTAQLRRVEAKVDILARKG